mgnify:CR=1 FL=1
MKSNFRNPPLRDKKHLAYIRTLPCCLCNAPPPSEAAHLRLGLAGGTAVKPGDDLTVPLCRGCHDLETRTGPRKFWRRWLAGDDVMVARTMHAIARSLVKS